MLFVCVCLLKQAAAAQVCDFTAPRWFKMTRYTILMLQMQNLTLLKKLIENESMTNNSYQKTRKINGGQLMDQQAVFCIFLLMYLVI